VAGLLSAIDKFWICINGTRYPIHHPA